MAVINFKRDEGIKLANCLSSDSVEDVVYVTGDDVSGRIQVSKVDIDDGAKMPGIGVIVSKSSSTECKVRVGGELVMIGTPFSPGNIVFASLSATLDTSAPSRPGSGTRLIQRMGIALADNKLVITPSTSIQEIQP